MVWRDLLCLLILFLCLALFAALYYVLKYKGKEKLLRFIGAFCGAGFCALFLYLAVFSRSPYDTNRAYAVLVIQGERQQILCA